MNFQICIIKALIKLKTKKIKKLLQSDLENTLIEVQNMEIKIRIKKIFLKKNYHCIFVICLKRKVFLTKQL